MIRTGLLALSAAALAVAAASCGGAEGTADAGGPTPTPTPAGNTYEVCVAHFEVDVGDAPDVANLVLLVLASEYWLGDAQPVAIDGFTGALYADYHYAFGAPLPAEYVGAISTSATVTVTGTSSALGAASQVTIEADPLWYLVTSTADTVTGGSGSVSGTLQPLSNCPGAGCELGSGSVSVMVNGSSLTVGTADPDGVALLYCRDLPSAFAEWRPGRPLPAGFRELFH